MFTYNNTHLLKNGRPWFPFMGEIHYSRLPDIEWRDSLLKMKAGGITVVASYTFWNHHEEVKGEWDFTGCRNLQKFVQTVKDCGLYMLLRIGPWSHGEARNGGFPDWLSCGGQHDPVQNSKFEQQAGCKIRTNDPVYLQYAEAFYRQLFAQVEGLLHKDGGPIIGVQIENEYGHCGGLKGEAGEEHMRTLTQLAKTVGFDVPLYTATGWNGAITAGLLPVMGGYPDAPWDRRITEIEPSGCFVISHERNDTCIGNDYGIGRRLSYDASKFPFLTAELGGGLQVTRHRRPVTSPQDIAAMSVAKMASGCNLLGYYMYHGGVHPQGKLTTLQETKASGSPNDLPEISYDFQAPLGAYGQYHGSYHELRLLGMFAADFGGTLCEMPPIIPDCNPQNPADKQHLRHSFRHNGEWGYVFFCNYVRHMQRPDFPQVKLTVPGLGQPLPTFDVQAGQYGFYPFNMPVEGGIVTFAQATPLCKIGKTTVFYGHNMDATGDVLLISREEALDAYKVNIGGTERLVISNNPLVQDGDEVHIFATGDIKLKVYPALENVPNGFEYKGMDGVFGVFGVFGVYEKPLPLLRGESLPYEAISKTGERYRIILPTLPTTHDIVCRINYTAESATVYANGQPIMDDFYKDGQLTIALRRHNFPEELEIELTPLSVGDPIYLESWPVMHDGAVCRLDGVKVTPMQRVVIV